MPARGLIQISAPPVLDDRRLYQYLLEVQDELQSSLIQVWNLQAEVPAQPWDGLVGLALYSPVDGNGLYTYRSGAWHKITDTAATVFP